MIPNKVPFVINEVTMARFRFIDEFALRRHCALHGTHY